jgi:hypothetical protein
LQEALNSTENKNKTPFMISPRKVLTGYVDDIFDVFNYDDE